MPSFTHNWTQKSLYLSECLPLFLPIYLFVLDCWYLILRRLLSYFGSGWINHITLQVSTFPLSLLLATLVQRIVGFFQWITADVSFLIIFFFNRILEVSVITISWALRFKSPKFRLQLGSSACFKATDYHILYENTWLSICWQHLSTALHISPSQARDSTPSPLITISVNHANRNASNDMSHQQVFNAYSLSVITSCSVALGLNKMVQHSSAFPQILGTAIRSSAMVRRLWSTTNVCVFPTLVRYCRWTNELVQWL